MQRKLTDLQLKNARELYATGGYTKTEIAQLFEVSITTMCLWLSDEQTIRKTLNKKKRTTRIHCDKCGISYAKHHRCPRCKCLLCEGTMLCDWCIEDIGRKN